MATNPGGTSGPVAFPVLQVRTPQLVQRAAPPAMWLPASALAVSMAIAAAGGVVLGLLAALQFGATSRWIPLVQAHAILQLWGWVAVSVAALIFEFIVRLNRHAALPVVPRIATLLLLASGAIIAAGGASLGGSALAASIGAALIAAGSVGFLVLVLRVPPARPLGVDLHPLFFRASAVWLVIAAVLLAIGAWRSVEGVVTPPMFDASTEVFLLGFCMNAIVAVGLRAFPGHLGLVPVSVRQQRVGVTLLNATVILRLAASPAVGFPSATAAHVVDLGVVLTVGWATAVFAVWRAVRAWRNTGERPQILVPIAWIGLVAYGAAVGLGVIGGLLGHEPTFVTAGAVRHLFMAGFLAPLLIAMIHVVLERFGTGALVWRNPLTAAFVLIVLAWPLRAVPPILDPAVGEGTRASMGVAGALLSAGLGLAAAVAGRNAWEVVRFARQFGRGR